MNKNTRRRPAAEWRGLVQEWRQSGATREAFAAAHELRSATLGWWASELTRRSRPSPVEKKQSVKGEHATFLPVRVIGETSSSRAVPAVKEIAPESRASELYAEIVLAHDRVLRVPVGADAAWVGRLAVALQAGERC